MHLSLSHQCSSLTFQSGQHAQSQFQFTMPLLDRVQKHVFSWTQTAPTILCKASLHATLARGVTIAAAGVKMVAPLLKKNPMRGTISCFCLSLIRHHNMTSTNCDHRLETLDLRRKPFTLCDNKPLLHVVVYAHRSKQCRHPPESRTSLPSTGSRTC